MNKNPEDHHPSDGDESQNQGKRPDGPVDPLGAMFQQMFGGTGAQSPGSNATRRALARLAANRSSGPVGSPSRFAAIAASC